MIPDLFRSMRLQEFEKSYYLIMLHLHYTLHFLQQDSKHFTNNVGSQATASISKDDEEVTIKVFNNSCYYQTTTTALLCVEYFATISLNINDIPPDGRNYSHLTDEKIESKDAFAHSQLGPVSCTIRFKGRPVKIKPMLF